MSLGERAHCSPPSPRSPARVGRMPTTGRGAGWHQLVRAARASLSAQSAATTSIERERDYLDKRALGAAQGRLGAESAGAETSKNFFSSLQLSSAAAFQGLLHAWLSCGCGCARSARQALRPLAMWSAPNPPPNPPGTTVTITLTPCLSLRARSLSAPPPCERARSPPIYISERKVLQVKST